MTENTKTYSKILSTNAIAKAAVLGALSFLLMFIQIPVFFAPGFMKIDFSDVPALLGGFAMGPAVGVLIELIKNILNLIKGATFGVGELSNFIVGSSLVFVSASMYKKERTMKGAIKGMIFGVLVMTTIATLSNTFLIFPMYAKAMGVELQSFVDMMQGINGLVNSYPTLMLFAIAPFNIFKGALEVVAVRILYKKVSPILKKKN
ncbi:MAG: ECF transporter S component [Peptoniphilaceae bacterium]|nr:ECF transporter S component [Peptoniphilaceae bacterium]MDD7383195.1 ECF transporter S component [Peptoniphilaceae bacterium]MDY3738419.1 ECF transporter S component [Peptoniphilaceae bacterium]